MMISNIGKKYALAKAPGSAFLCHAEKQSSSI